MFTIQPLDLTTLEAANILRNHLFHYLSKYEKKTLEASLAPSEYELVYEKLAIRSLSYWIGKLHDTIIGIIGLYEEKDDASDKIWLGWYGIDPQYRGQSYGKQLMEFVLQEARIRNKQHIKLYTTSHDEYAVARKYYEKLGFKRKTSKSKTLYYHLDLGLS